MSFPQLRSKILNPLATSVVVAAYTLSAAAGSVIWTGTDATPKAGHVLSASPGSVTQTGTAATLNKGFTLASAAGSVAWTGTAANFALSMPASTSAYSWTGTVATLTYGSLSADLSVNYDWGREYPRAFQQSKFGKQRFEFVNAYALTSDPGAYSILGTDPTLRASVGTGIRQRDKRINHTWPRPFAPSPWGHLTGQRSINRISYATATYSIVPDSGTYTWTGTAVTFRVGHILAAVDGNWSWNVTSATLNKGATLVTTPGSLLITAPDLIFAVKMPATAGAWLWTGTDIDMNYSNAPTTVRGMMLMGVG